METYMKFMQLHEEKERRRSYVDVNVFECFAMAAFGKLYRNKARKNSCLENFNLQHFSLSIHLIRKSISLR